MAAIVARRCFVSGRVQGVFYRASTRQKAADLGLSGYACNLADGRVEVLAVGELAAVTSLIDWLSIGPASAQVASVEVREVDLDTIDDVPVGFATR
ncbi:acylphosphatase [Povalibacter sp.]|uniref:acylphosphatase n=1 Tax=Povalibacter sp. TaxID=1962978 RepID=UPI002F42C769